MDAEKNVALEPELYERVGKLAEAEGKTVDELANDALRRDVLRRGLRSFVAQNRKDTEAVGLTGADVPRLVDAVRRQR